MAAPRELRFCWWNVQDFAHFDPNRSAMARWPTSVAEYEEKRRRLETAFDAMFGADVPEVIGLCEITRTAARELQKRKLQDHDLILSEPLATDAFQVVLFIRRNRSLARRRSLIAEDVSEGTRPMCAAVLEEPSAGVLFVACHWPAFDKPTSKESRRRCADTLRGGVYDFLFPRRPAATPRHVVVIGDLNAEPFDDLFELTLYASRDRDHARQRSHHTDGSVSRARLYNCGWRLLGERTPHGLPESPERRVGTYYQASSRSWRTYDQVLVSGGLLTGQAPYLDEAALLVRSDVVTWWKASRRSSRTTTVSGPGCPTTTHSPVESSSDEIPSCPISKSCW